MRPKERKDSGTGEFFDVVIERYPTVTHDQFAIIQDRLNNRPRMRLGFKTPDEVFQASSKSIALRD